MKSLCFCVCVWMKSTKDTQNLTQSYKECGTNDASTFFLSLLCSSIWLSVHKVSSSKNFWMRWLINKVSVIMKQHGSKRRANKRVHIDRIIMTIGLTFIHDQHLRFVIKGVCIREKMGDWYLIRNGNRKSLISRNFWNAMAWMSPISSGAQAF